LANDFMRQYVSHDNKDFDDDYNQWLLEHTQLVTDSDDVKNDYEQRIVTWWARCRNGRGVNEVDVVLRQHPADAVKYWPDYKAGKRLNLAFYQTGQPLLNPEDGRDIFFWNLSWLSTDNKVLYPRI
jgi:hypothetical protein